MEKPVEPKFKNLVDMFDRQTAAFGDATVARNKENGQWVDYSWNQIATMAEEMSLGMLALGIPEQSCVAILCENRPEWSASDRAILSIRCADVPIYPTMIAEQAEYILRHADVTLCICSTAEQMEKLLAVRRNYPELKHIIVIDPPNATPDGVMSLDELRELGRDKGDKAELAKRKKAITPRDLATIIYTSGTTGPPKGARLTHNNLLMNAAVANQVHSAMINDVSHILSFLPLSHSFERTAGYYTAIYHGKGKVSYLQDFSQLLDNLPTIQPELACSVPRLFEKIYAGVMARREQLPEKKRKMFDWAVKTGMEWVRASENGGSPGLVLNLKYKAADKIIFDKVRQGLGGNLKYMVSGGGPLAADIARFMRACGVRVYEGYGLTETSPVASCNRADELKYGSIGKPIPGVEMKIAEDGEILIRGHNIMEGYHKNPEATAEAIDSDGWFHSGDIGEKDADGFFRITDRKKDLIITAGGKNIAPQNVENKLKVSNVIEQVAMIGDNRPYCVALIVPNFETLENMADEKGWDKSPEALAKNPAVLEMIQNQVDAVNANLSRYETIKKFTVLAEPFSIENGMLTPTMKVRRPQVTAAHKDAIEAMYQ